jgi:hypothetical protein
MRVLFILVVACGGASVDRPTATRVIESADAPPATSRATNAALPPNEPAQEPSASAELASTPPPVTARDPEPDAFSCQTDRDCTLCLYPYVTEMPTPGPCRCDAGEAYCGYQEATRVDACARRERAWQRICGPRVHCEPESCEPFDWNHLPRGGCSDGICRIVYP